MDASPRRIAPCAKAQILLQRSDGTPCLHRKVKCTTCQNFPPAVGTRRPVRAYSKCPKTGFGTSEEVPRRKRINNACARPVHIRRTDAHVHRSPRRRVVLQMPRASARYDTYRFIHDPFPPHGRHRVASAKVHSSSNVRFANNKSDPPVSPAVFGPRARPVSPSRLTFRY